MCGNARERSNSETLEIAYLHMCRQYMCVCVCVCVCVGVTVVCVCVCDLRRTSFSSYMKSQPPGVNSFAL